jgi:dihydroflavonol-4-reductase
MAAQFAFVTGSTGLLGNNLVRELLACGFKVRALARTQSKAEQQFQGLDVEVVEGDIQSVEEFKTFLRGVDIVFHTAAFFRDSYKGGSHWKELNAVNVLGTKSLLEASYEAGVRNFIHVSSIAVLNGGPGQIINETMLRDESEADDYYRSKILSDKILLEFLDSHPDMHACMILPGWMHGPGDTGPTSAGQTVLDFAEGKLPGIVPASFSVVDARDVADAMILAAERGRRGERYLAAGRHYTMAELFPLLEQATGAKAPGRRIPMALLYAIAAINELMVRLTRKPALLSWATVKLMAQENDRTRFDLTKSKRELGVTFRPALETLRDEVKWYRDHGWMKPTAGTSR